MIKSLSSNKLYRVGTYRIANRRHQIIAIIMAIICAFYVLYLIHAPIKSGDSQIIKIEVKRGDNLAVIAQGLKDAGLIRSRMIFIFYVKALDKESALQAGTYSLSRSMSIDNIIQIIINGFADSNDIQILLAEGFNIWEMDKRLVEYGAGEKTYFATKYLNKEGYFFPDTYRIARPFDSAHGKPESGSFDLKLLSDEVATKMQSAFDQKTTELFKKLDNKQRERVVIIASILEKETRTLEDMRLVSGIIEERIKRGMNLKLDATVSYGACLRIFKESGYRKDCDVTQIGVAKEIKIDGPYNSYLRLGLPPGPISNPGLDAIKAALNPQKSPYLYYLSTRDTGQIIYAKTSEEQAVNRKKYLGL